MEDDRTSHRRPSFSPEVTEKLANKSFNRVGAWAQKWAKLRSNRMVR